MQGGDQVVVLLAPLVVEQGFLGDALGQGVLGHPDGVALGLPVEHRHFQGGQGAAGVPVGKDGNGLQGLRGNVHLLLAKSPRVRQCPAQKPRELLHAQGLEHEHLAPGEKRPVHLKGGVLRGGPDKDNAPLFHKGQEGVLLGLVKAVDFVHKDDGALPEAAVFLRLEHHLPDLLDAAGHRGKVDEGGLGALGDDPRQGGLAHPRRAPENHGGYAVPLNEPAEHLPRAQQMGLPGEFLQGAGAHARRQGLRRVVGEKALLFHGASSFAAA